MSDSTVAKSVMETYTIIANHEHATIALRCWSRPVKRYDGKPDLTYHCGEILINSSFGSWANIWTACGTPFKDFLIDADFGYLFTKFMGTKLERHDGEGTMLALRRDIIEQRRHGSLDHHGAREVWDAVDWERDRIESDATSCGYALLEVASQIGGEHPMYDYFADPSAWPRVTKHDCQAVGFWREIWPHFVAELKREADLPAGVSASQPSACAQGSSD